MLLKDTCFCLKKGEKGRKIIPPERVIRCKTQKDRSRPLPSFTYLSVWSFALTLQLGPSECQETDWTPGGRYSSSQTRLISLSLKFPQIECSASYCCLRRPWLKHLPSAASPLPIAPTSCHTAPLYLPGETQHPSKPSSSITSCLGWNQLFAS